MSKIWTAQELSSKTASEQDAIFQESILRNLDAAPRGFLSRVRERFKEHLSDMDQ